MNGSIRFGTFFTFFGGTIVANGFVQMDKNMTLGIVLVVLGIALDIMGINSVEKGVKETLRVRDLERKAGVRKNV
ncbi:hypothetical protein SEA_ANNADREAMY_220 [Streptomyces phage Annadreamy]|uniref:Uncharacterized protein n=2 Tax=Annadreamyvirus annadreamy TaxID=2846392 RepID=A0A345GTN3_9CAUD|nr:hypothetical protein HWB75_gp058 [Streptomyces phage Annadreamy]AXG66305.1 hypothetical protein SEA_ANNADREAMY_220 [Streptomyces phage Annadreamy]QGH79528.1 hypothetical protein SEA_LIMPID_227 [Streptomyces phage Limpid]